VPSTKNASPTSRSSPDKQCVFKAAPVAFSHFPRRYPLSELITSTLEADGLLLASIDMADRTMNVFSFALMDELDALMDRVECDDTVKAVVLTSGKSSFLAGADLMMVRGFCSEARTATHERMFDICGRLGRQFVRLETSSKPWVAAVNGLALGGGLELSMACRARLVENNPRIQLGLPEIRWGLLPGAGGTQRLPRLVGYDLGMTLLLTGRSLTPQEAVESGLFSAAHPAAQLLDEARKVARSLIGQAYHPRDKFRFIDQTEVPVHSQKTALAQAQCFGISSDSFALYPAYSAIVDSVLKGARQPLTEANATEMNQFLRLMFSPVAGRMVRTLFLERLRAERELAAPPEVNITKIRHGRITDARKAWADALAKVKLEQVIDETLPQDTLEIIDTIGLAHRVHLQVLGDAVRGPDVAGVLAPLGPYGRVMEIVGSDKAATHALSALATRMWTLAWPSSEPVSMLQALQGKPLAEQAMLAAQWAARPGNRDLNFIDVAACLSGVSPGWTGGPLAWLWDEQATQEPLFDSSTRSAWAHIRPQLEQACS
jgi:3-hydroxyacyl-CoA dehydrogenase/enoyl-CoA hydratase/3-hydroxybutyryl-CoA epimerase